MIDRMQDADTLLPQPVKTACLRSSARHQLKRQGRWEKGERIEAKWRAVEPMRSIFNLRLVTFSGLSTSNSAIQPSVVQNSIVCELETRPRLGETEAWILPFLRLAWHIILGGEKVPDDTTPTRMKNIRSGVGKMPRVDDSIQRYLIK